MATFIKNLYKYLVVTLFRSILILKKSNNQFLIPANLLILAPHPDDEILGIGGIILQTLKQGDKVHFVYLTDGEVSGVWTDTEEIKHQRIELSECVCKKLGLKDSDITRLHLPDGAVPHPGQTGFDEWVQIIKHSIETIKPDAVFATHTLDYWPYDHVACAHIAREAIKQSTVKPQLWYYWVWAWYNLKPLQLVKLHYINIFKIDIRDQLAQKKELIDLYLNKLTPEGKPWSGILPKTLLKALRQPFEIIEKIKIEE